MEWEQLKYLEPVAFCYKKKEKEKIRTFRRHVRES